MVQRKNPFIRIKQFYYEDGMDIHWWVDEDEHEDFKLNWKDQFEIDENGEIPLKCTDERIVNGKQYNEWMFGNVYGDHEGNFIDQDCPACDHLLVTPSRHEEYFTGEELHCSACEWQNVPMKDFWEKNKAEWDDIRSPDKPPEIKIRLAGEDIFQFCERVGLRLSRKDSFFKQDNNYWTDCVVCKKQVPASDFYIGQDTGFAVVTFSHDNCTNRGPSIGTPFKKKTKETWGAII